jgi:hypothetical protein
VASKFRNIKSEYAGFSFDSLKERQRYVELEARLRRGEIKNLRVHPKFEIKIGAVKICDYIGDFAYDELVGDFMKGGYPGDVILTVVEDVKSPATLTPVFRLKEKMMLALHGIKIVRVGLPVKTKRGRKAA